jgi:A/G-specific adenine glycosylase
VRRDGFLLVRSRPPKGLLGGMTEVPTTTWTHDFDAVDALAQMPHLRGAKPDWRRIPGTVTHVFTHFPLELAVYTAAAPKGTSAPDGARWIALTEIADEAFPNVMRKVVAHALGDGKPKRDR